MNDDNVIEFEKPEETGTLTCGMCLEQKPPDVLVPVCGKCASKLENHLKHILASVHDIIKLLYPKSVG